MTDCLVLSVTLPNHSIFVWYDWELYTYIVKGVLPTTNYSYCMDTTGNVVNYIKYMYDTATTVKVQLMNYKNLPLQSSDVDPKLLYMSYDNNGYQGSLLKQYFLKADTEYTDDYKLRICDKLHSLVNVVGKTYNY